MTKLSWLIIFTPAVLIVLIGCSHSTEIKQPHIYRGGQSYDEAVHAGDLKK